ncbi:MAG: hypothetical protein ABI972_15035, partial [Acidobacteriota bacterium]
PEVGWTPSMRFMILLLFGGMGGMLLFLGWTRYQTATNQLNAWPRASGVVVQAADDGYVVHYQVRDETHESAGGQVARLARVARRKARRPVCSGV